jgi:hypothetical protein
MCGLESEQMHGHRSECDASCHTKDYGSVACSSAAQLSWRRWPVGENGEGSINFGCLGFPVFYM